MPDPEPLDVRAREPADLAACVAIAEEVRRTDGYPSFLGDGTLESFVSPDDALGTWVAVLDGRVVGTVALRPRSAPASAALATVTLGVEAERLAFVARLMVAPGARRRGAARRLLDVAVGEARRRGLVCVLDVVTHDAAAVELYEQSGWRRLGRNVITLRDGTELPIETFAAPPGPSRDPAPPYRGEGPFALWHVSEDPSLSRLAPRVHPRHPGAGGLVWAVDTRHLPLFWFPRECPRGCVWASAATTPADREAFFGMSDATRLHVVESSWVERILASRLVAYELPPGGFEPHDEVGGYWVSREPVEAVGRVELDGLVQRHADAGFELRVTPSIRPFWRRVVASTLEYSGMQLERAAAPEEPPG